MRRPDDGEFGELVAARSHALRRTAYLMCGDWHQAEDLVQITFIKLRAAWGRVRRQDDLDDQDWLTHMARQVAARWTARS